MVCITHGKAFLKPQYIFKEVQSVKMNPRCLWLSVCSRRDLARCLSWGTEHLMRAFMTAFPTALWGGWIRRNPLSHFQSEALGSVWCLCYKEMHFLTLWQNLQLRWLNNASERGCEKWKMWHAGHTPFSGPDGREARLPSFWLTGTECNPPSLYWQTIFFFFY